MGTDIHWVVIYYVTKLRERVREKTKMKEKKCCWWRSSRRPLQLWGDGVKGKNQEVSHKELREGNMTFAYSSTCLIAAWIFTVHKCLQTGIFGTWKIQQILRRDHNCTTEELIVCSDIFHVSKFMITFFKSDYFFSPFIKGCNLVFLLVTDIILH